MSIDFRHLSEQLERISSQRLALRPVSLADAWPLYQATRNPNFNKHLLWGQPRNEEELLERVDAISIASRSGQMAALSAVVRDTGEWVSLYRFQPYIQDRSAVEMGVWTHDRFWHGRYSLELVRLCIDAAFENSDVKQLVGSCVPENRSSCQLMRLAGMAQGDLLTRETEGGRFVAAQEFVITRAAWLERTGRKVSFFAFPRRGQGWLQQVPPVPPVARIPRRDEELMAA